MNNSKESMFLPYAGWSSLLFTVSISLFYLVLRFNSEIEISFRKPMFLIATISAVLAMSIYIVAHALMFGLTETCVPVLWAHRLPTADQKRAVKKFTQLVAFPLGIVILVGELVRFAMVR